MVSGTPPLTIKWFKNKKEVSSSVDCSVIKDNTSSSLELFFAKTSDSGEYVCEIQNDVGSTSCQATLFVKDVSWFREGSEISPGSRYNVAFVNSVATLEIRGTDVKDSGLYYCEARNEAGSESCSMDLRVKEPPSFIRELAPADVVQGTAACFECQVAGTGPFEITWHKDAKEIKPSAKHGLSQISDAVGLEVQRCDVVDVGEYQCTVANEVGTCTYENWILEDTKIERTFENNVATLRIPACEVTHNGKYTCQVVNEAGQDKCFATLTVQEPPQITEKPEVI
ncbi:hypothetical protein FQN60_012540, partial [Etheostoma spectabile]